MVETRDRSGVLVYVSQVERLVSIVADRGVLAKVERSTWARVSAELERVVASGADGVAWARTLLELLPLLAAAVPRREDDVNELEDVV